MLEARTKAQGWHVAGYSILFYLDLAQSWDASDLIFLTPLVRARIKPVLSWRITCGDLIFHVWRYTEYWEAVCCLHSQSGWNGRLCHYYLASGSFVAARSGQLASGAATSPSPRHHPAWGHHHCAVASSLLSRPRHFAKDQLAAYSLAPFLWTSLSPPSVEQCEYIFNTKSSIEKKPRPPFWKLHYSRCI